MKARRKARRQRLDSLRSLHLFAGCSDAELRAIDRLGSEISLEPGAPLLNEYSSTLEFVQIREGVASVRRDGDEVAVLERGAFAGEVGILSGRPWRDGVVAKTKVCAAVLNVGEFYELINVAPAVRSVIERAARERLWEISETIAAGPSEPVRHERLQVLRQPALAERYGRA